MIRLEEKITNLESENQVLRQQAVSMAPNKFLSGRSRSVVQVILNNEYYMHENNIILDIGLKEFFVCQQRTESGHIVQEAKTTLVTKSFILNS